MCRILVKAQVLTGDDSHSRIGTKHSALPYDLLELLKNLEIQTIYAKKSWNEQRIISLKSWLVQEVRLITHI